MHQSFSPTTNNLTVLVLKLNYESKTPQQKNMDN